jgi:hypothetical protein
MYPRQDGRPFFGRADAELPARLGRDNTSSHREECPMKRLLMLLLTLAAIAASSCDPVNVPPEDLPGPDGGRDAGADASSPDV